MWSTEGWPLPDEINRDFNVARNFVQPRDPLILDLDSDGIEATAIDPSSPVLFDHDADGVVEASLVFEDGGADQQAQILA